MQKIKTLSNIYVSPEPTLNGTSLYLKLHIITNQMERLQYTKETCLKKIEMVDKRLGFLEQRKNILKNKIN